MKYVLRFERSGPTCGCVTFYAIHAFFYVNERTPWGHQKLVSVSQITISRGNERGQGVKIGII